MDFWNLVDIYNPDVIIGTEPWLREEISNAELFRDEYTTFSRDGITLLARSYGWTRISR
jgi:hypothetical protein